MSLSASDQTLYQIVTEPDAVTIDDVLAKMKRIDAALDDNDGLKWFNHLYSMVTEEVDLRPPAGGWKDAIWLDRLDVVFAGLYFKAVRASLDKKDAPNAWDALMEARFRGGVDRIQFALAGMNAHINHDLALALIETSHQSGITPTAESPQYVDYQAVNQLLEAVMPRALDVLATGLLGQLAQDTGKIGRLLAFWNVCKARDLAWDYSNHLREIHGLQRALGLAAQDRITGVVGRAILVFR
ncbi:DUF5995 family protein [Edaphobacter modestus]|uniref:Uncharacterized protein n=1 Tax=Edaphobacter modestus TaxID=388466 RepID=A0A4Q7YY54_9BACT|nr:DUF5995 family protein [Edaphobacter modestus]RZU42103.1 hypothetical protein BDD14_3649 [Edaphobacter modestus]